MSKAFNFTKASLTSLTNDTGKRLYIYDDNVKGLSLSVTPAGVKSFLVYKKIGAKPVRVTLGRFPDMTIEQARRLAKTAIAKLAEGINPIAEKRAKKIASYTLLEVFEAYKEMKVLKPTTLEDYDKTINQTFSDWKNKPLALITSEMVQKRHAERGKASRGRANNAFRVLRALFNFAKYSYKDADNKSFFPDNPVSILSETKSWYKLKPKVTYLNNSDLRIWYKVITDFSRDSSDAMNEVISDYQLFILFTGVRREEAAPLKKEDINLKEKTFTLVDTKNNTSVTLPMSEPLYLILKRRVEHSPTEYIFPGVGKKGYLVNPWEQIFRIAKKCGIRCSVHDLRRTFITIGESLDISPYTLKRLANHKISAESDVTVGYIIPNPERLREATDKIAREILRILN